MLGLGRRGGGGAVVQCASAAMCDERPAGKSAPSRSRKAQMCCKTASGKSTGSHPANLRRVDSIVIFAQAAAPKRRRSVAAAAPNRSHLAS